MEASLSDIARSCLKNKEQQNKSNQTSKTKGGQIHE
jgi:hypothetical protein